MSDHQFPASRELRPQHRGQSRSETYQEVFAALGPVEPLHHRGGLHLLPLHAGDAAQLHGVALDGLSLRGHLHAHGEAHTGCREAGRQGRDAGRGVSENKRERRDREEGS